MIDRENLQVDDLISYLYHPYRIVEIGLEKATIKEMNYFEDEPDNPENYEFVSYDDLEPIDLTEEILELNGWKKHPYTVSIEHKNEEGGSIWEQKGFPSLGKIKETDSFKYTLAMPIYYVHDLQHLIKSCKVYKFIII